MARLTGLVVKGVALTAADARKDIMSWTGWSKEHYRKQYDIFKLKLRSYEELYGGAKQSPLEFMWKYYKASTTPGYRPSTQMQIILSTPAYSTKTRAKAIERKLSKGTDFSAEEKTLRDMVIQDFNALIDASVELNNMVEQIKNPYKLLRFLKTYAKELHAQQAILRKQQEGARGSIGYEETNAIMLKDLEKYLG